MTSARRALLVPLALAILLVGPLVLVAGRVAERMGVDRPYEVSYIPHGRALAFLSPGAKLSVANAYWLATVQYIGGQHLAQGRFDQLYPLIDLVTDLDPLHGYAFQTGGIVLSSAQRLEESDLILKKGIERGPNWWSYPFYLAFNDYFWRGDYDSAARWASQAARTPGASPNISHLALALEVKHGDPEAGLALLEELLKSSRDDQVRERLEEQYRLARLQVDFTRLDGAVARYTTRHGRPPDRLDRLVEDGLLPAIPPEPFGGRYELRADGRVHSTGRDFHFQPPEPGRAARGAPPATHPAPPLLQEPRRRDRS
jgi:tetratricopeptide (TPR) repeat protein